MGDIAGDDGSIVDDDDEFAEFPLLYVEVRRTSGDVEAFQRVYKSLAERMESYLCDGPRDSAIDVTRLRGELEDEENEYFGPGPGRMLSVDDDSFGELGMV